MHGSGREGAAHVIGAAASASATALQHRAAACCPFHLAAHDSIGVCHRADEWAAAVVLH